MAIHPQAIVDPLAVVHDDATVGPFCVVQGKVTIEAGAELRNNVTVYGRATIGSGTVVFPGAVIGGDPQHLGYRGEDSEVIIGKNCRIHECATINKGTAGGGMVTEIGDGTMIMAYAHIAHDCRIGADVVIGNNTQVAGHCLVGRKCVISGMVGLHHFITIGELSFVGGMSGVRSDIPPYVMADGVPAEVRNINAVGLRRDGWNDTDIRATKEAFRALYRGRNGTPLSEVLERLNNEPGERAKPVETLYDWLSRSLNESVNGRMQQAQR